MRICFAFALVLVAVPASAQIENPGATVSDMQALAASIPQPGTGSPTAIVDANSGTAGAAGLYAPFNHTHPSKARKGRVLVPSTGTFDVAFSPAFSTGAPLCSVTAEAASGDTNVVNAQIDGAAFTTGMRIRITRTALTVNGLLGLTILSLPTQVATYAHYICIEP